MSIEHSGIIEENQTGFLFEEARYLDNDLHPDLLEFFNKNRANNASTFNPKLYIPSTLNIDLIQWHIKLIVCAENVKSWFKS